MNIAKKATKISRETKWATLGRAIADSSRIGENPAPLILEAAILRQSEQEQRDKATRFAGLARQVGDAARNGAEIGPLLLLLRDLRTTEIG
jgi:xanthine dehydrogenase iron-sulfur cluster and FAD-binding subunit A